MICLLRQIKLYLAIVYFCYDCNHKKKNVIVHSQVRASEDDRDCYESEMRTIFGHNLTLSSKQTETIL